jgi:hypothetical protein
MEAEVVEVEKHRATLEKCLKQLLAGIGEVQIGKPGQFPYGWRKAAKGRTVWRLLEEVISQNLEAQAGALGIHDFTPADSEVGVYDFSFRFEDSKTLYVNIKSAVQGGRVNKDDISKADKLVAFFENTHELTLFVATIEIQFLVDPIRLALTNCYVVPTAWLPDVYVNPSNNGNLQSSKYKDLAAATRRTRQEFVSILKAQLAVARDKRVKKITDY